jgi:heme-degrading monooxygenase HmoA
MFAMVTHLRFRDGNGPQMEAAEARSQAAEMAAQPGFRAFYLVRVAETEALFIRVYDTREEALEGLKHGFRPQLGAEFAAPPDRKMGPVLAHAATV